MPLLSSFCCYKKTTLSLLLKQKTYLLFKPNFQMIKKTYLMLFIIAVLTCCKSKETTPPKSNIIDFSTIVEKPTIFNGTDLFESIQYIPLETKEGSLISGSPSPYITNNEIIIKQRKQMLRFERKTGKLIGEIGKQGNGPNEFDRTLWGVPFDEKNKTIIAKKKGGKSLIKYDLEGNVLDKFDAATSYGNTSFINDSIYACYIPNLMGKQETKINIFNNKGKTLTKFPNFQSFSNTDNSITILAFEGILYRWNKQLYFKEAFNDTLFHVTKDALKPHYIFNFGKYATTYSKRNELLKQHVKQDGTKSQAVDKLFLGIHMVESSKYLLHQYRYQKESYWACFDKEKQASASYKNNGNMTWKGSKNYPFKFNKTYINSKNELVTYMQAIDIIQWFDEHPKAQLPESLKHLKKLTENDNPVIIIAQLKH
ncbi:6-bladed beta-propeller [Prolixibacteraceae bacterium JC049]|nr:6-bladed beta-propeller [Prolixibacteraceae bacterium JC049]